MIVKKIFFYEDNCKKDKHWDIVLYTIVLCLLIIFIMQQLYSYKLRRYEQLLEEHGIVYDTNNFKETLPNSVSTEVDNINSLYFTDYSSINDNITANNTSNDVIHTDVQDSTSTTYTDYFWIGDSRTVGLGQFYDINYIAEVGCGYNYLVQHLEEIKNIKNCNVIINLGVNDLYNIYNYEDIYNYLPNEFYYNNNVYFLSVNPCNGDYSYLNTDINNFNNKMLTELRDEITFIDSNTYLKSNGFDTVDGLHYTKDTYSKIYNFVLESTCN